MKVKVTQKFYDEKGKLIRIETWEEYREHNRRKTGKDAENP